MADKISKERLIEIIRIQHPNNPINTNKNNSILDKNLYYYSQLAIRLLGYETTKNLLIDKMKQVYGDNDFKELESLNENITKNRIESNPKNKC